MEQITVIDRIFNKYFDTLKEKLHPEIVDNLIKVFINRDSIETNLAEFIKWLGDYNSKDKKSKY